MTHSSLIPSTATRPATLSPRLLVLSLAVLCLLVVMGTMARDVRDRLNDLEAASSDNGPWVMSQIEVETLRLRLALSEAQRQASDARALAEFRLWFDVLYSRLTLLEQSPLYRSFAENPDNKALLAELHGALEDWVPLIDGPDAALMAALPDIRARIEALHGFARELALAGLKDISVRADETRAQIASTLIRLAMAATATFLLLAFLAAALLRLYRHSRHQADENFQTGARLQVIISTSPDAIVVTNRGGWTVEFNPAAEAMFGLTRAEIIGRQALPILFPEGKLAAYQALIAQAISQAVERGPQRFELEARRADGSAFPVEVSIAIRDLRQGALIVAFMRDISARKTAETALQEALVKARSGEKAKADFLAVMSHEMRTPLNGLMGSVELLRDTDLGEDQRKLLEILSDSGNVLLGHVNSVLDIARAEAGEIQIAQTPFDLDRLVAECIDNQAGLALRNGTQLRHVPLTGPLGMVCGDPARLRQILLNLIGNAVKFTSDGEITLETERHEARTARGQSGLVEFRVTDTGIGIAEADQGRIFEDFEMVGAGAGGRRGGTGLGLGIVRRLTRAMGGEVGVESEPGEGSVFWLRLPLPEAPPLTTAPLLAPGQPLPAQPPSAPDTGRRPGASAVTSSQEILVVEDNDINRFLLRRMLEAEGHRVTEAVDGIEGVAQARARHFDLILTDISMPRMDGVEATKQIRNSSGPSSTSRIIALTAHALPGDIDNFVAAGMNACLTKPVNRETLMAHINSDSGRPIPPAKDDPEAMPALDPAPLRDLHDELGAEMLQRLVGRLLDEADAKVAELHGYGPPDPEMGRIAHQLAGGCATFGAMRLRHHLSRIEAGVKTDQTEDAAAAAHVLPQVWAETRSALLDAVIRLGS